MKYYYTNDDYQISLKIVIFYKILFQIRYIRSIRKIKISKSRIIDIRLPKIIEYVDLDYFIKILESNKNNEKYLSIDKDSFMPITVIKQNNIFNTKFYNNLDNDKYLVDNYLNCY